ncbi:hypothetical protein [Nitratireductor thuwali]|uniref:Uncharacterized protein n=1 Tax=Nitratireductor thuwali TaxID=2267699 RepID=A0ABY5MGG8_9HYPH|nr:hypothetical protein NTH_01576 [Nitratireductor thuwali]
MNLQHQDHSTGFGPISRMASAGVGALRLALLFGSAGIALALILTPIADRQSRGVVVQGIGIDRTTTGSLPQRRGETITLRRSVLQPTASAVCVIRANGVRTGAC